MKTVRDMMEALQKENPDAPIVLNGYEFLWSWDGTFDRYESGAISPNWGEVLKDDGTPN